jgi:glycosyltransferase involved in cell wall biosynthesis
MARPPLSVTVITLNEEKNLARALESVKWADEILVVDSGSGDRTRQIALEHGARVIQNAWEGYGQQKNFAQAQAKHDWVLNIDADEAVPPGLQAQILARLETGGALGYRIPRKTHYLGRWIYHGGWYPNYLCRLADRRQARWTEPSVHEELKVRGRVEDLSEPLVHYSFDSIQDQVLTNLNFSWLGFQQLKARGREASLILLLLKPLSKFVETYLLKKGFLDGLPGFIISINAAHSAFLKYAYLFEAQIGEKPKKAQR